MQAICEPMDPMNVLHLILEQNNGERRLTCLCILVRIDAPALIACLASRQLERMHRAKGA